MNIGIEKNNGILVVKPSGRIDSNTSTDFEASLLGWIDEGMHHLVIDFSDVVYVSSAGLRVILMAAKRIKQTQGGLVLCALSESIREVFEITGFLAILTVTDTYAEALPLLNK